jgi:hypothetical protein
VLLCGIQLTPAVTESPNGMTLTTAKTGAKKRARESSQASDFAIANRAADGVVFEAKAILMSLSSIYTNASLFSGHHLWLAGVRKYRPFIIARSGSLPNFTKTIYQTSQGPWNVEETLKLCVVCSV